MTALQSTQKEWRWRVAALLCCGVGLLVSGCGHRAQPYFFANPMLAQAELRDETEPAMRSTTPARPAANPTAVANLETPNQRTATVRQVRAPEIRIAIAPRAVADLAAQQPHPLTAPHRLEVPETTRANEPLANYASLRGLVGTRTIRTPFEQVQAWRHELSDVAAPTVSSISDVVTQARAASTLWSAARFGAETVDLLRAGDVVVFDRAIDDAPASLLGLVAATDNRGVSEFFYVAAGVVRRGFIDPKRPSLARDAERRIVNTFLRHNHNQPPAGTRFLAGELFAAAVRP